MSDRVESKADLKTQMESSHTTHTTKAFIEKTFRGLTLKEVSRIRDKEIDSILEFHEVNQANRLHLIVSSLWGIMCTIRAAEEVLEISDRFKPPMSPIYPRLACEGLVVGWEYCLSDNPNKKVLMEEGCISGICEGSNGELYFKDTGICASKDMQPFVLAIPQEDQDVWFAYMDTFEEYERLLEIKRKASLGSTPMTKEEELQFRVLDSKMTAYKERIVFVRNSIRRDKDE